MRAWQFWTLNALSAILVVTVIFQYFVVRDVQRLSQTVMSAQREVQQAQAAEQLLRALAVRVAQAGETEKELNNILVKHNLRVNPGSGN
jgi:hypothetical protein